jgi:hypothetical protein
MSNTEAEPIYFHDCPALGPHARLPHAALANKDGSIVYAYQHKCPFCSQTAGELELTEAGLARARSQS